MAGRVVVLAGAGGNGGGGIACARHLHNRGFDVAIVLD
ncbi:MAG: NAD(P)H-hydrate epimerase, partial [Anaerolineae bacterium]